MTRDDVRMYRFRRGPIYGARPYTHASGLPGSHRWNWAGSINRTPTILNRYGVRIAARVSSMTWDDARMYRFVGAPFMAPEIHSGLCIICKSGFDESNPYDPEHVWHLHIMTGTKTVNTYHVCMARRVPKR